MACATLKRNLDWESMAQLPAKRRRCAPFATSSSTSPGIRVSENKPSSFGESISAPAKLTPGHIIPPLTKFRGLCDQQCWHVVTGYQPIAHIPIPLHAFTDAQEEKQLKHSMVFFLSQPSMEERMAQEICDEIKRLQRRRQLRLASGVPSCSSSSGSEGDCSPPHHSTHSQQQKVHNRALFTFKQVRMICERMLRDQEAALRAEYETALSNKLAEQYEAFVRFNLDQVQRRPPPPTCSPLGMDAEHHMHQDLVPSYLS